MKPAAEGKELQTQNKAGGPLVQNANSWPRLWDVSEHCQSPRSADQNWSTQESGSS